MEVSEANQYQAILSGSACREGQLLRVCEVTVVFSSGSARESVVLKHISFAIAQGEIVGLLGESGAGKTTTALSIMRLLPSVAHITHGTIEFQGGNLYVLNERQARAIRGSEISIVFQDSNVLNPVMRVGDQVMEVLQAHRNTTKAEMRKEIYELFSALGMDDCERIFTAYPHQLSGGQCRRIAIAQALICKPRLIIADEPTAWLDTGTTAEILALIRQLRDLYGTAFLLISHDPDALAAVADRVMVMYAGQIVESGPTSEVFSRPLHPYTRALLQCVPAEGVRNPGNQRSPLPFIPGQPPDPTKVLHGCSFFDRCNDRMDLCSSLGPQLVQISDVQSVRCFMYEEEG
jgi:peptide/nickel transport system ATP-binding protein